MYQRKDGLYESQRVVNGKKVAFRGKTESEVLKKIDAYKSRMAYIKTVGLTFKDVEEEYKRTAFPALSFNTVCSYTVELKHLSWLEEKYIIDITFHELKEYINELAAQDYSKKSVTNILIVLRGVFKLALEREYITTDPTANLRLPKNLRSKRREAASIEDERKIMEHSDFLLPFFVLMTGARKGEAIACRWDDIDFENNRITINKSAYDDYTKIVIKTPKTENGIRIVPLLAPLAERLKQEKRKTGYIFSTDGGKTPIRFSAAQSAYKRFKKEYGVSCTLHQLRHSYATMLYEFDIDVKSAQALLGHANISTTQDIYTHFRNTHLDRITEKLNKRWYTESSQ